jgi:hypothetical protein
MIVTVAHKDALASLVECTLANEYDYVCDEMSRFDSFIDWAEFVIHETLYGAANVVAFVDSSDSEMLKDLREMWDRESEARKKNVSEEISES